MKSLAIAGFVSVSINNKLVCQAMKAHRIDVLIVIVEYCADLTEYKVVDILRVVTLLPESFLVRFI